ncbi:MAG TPA: hypothetical protein VGN70_08320 [Gammaproteobacteria bacterium]|jgi:hypothetical protein
MRLEFRKWIWWVWLATGCLLTAGVFGWALGFTLAIGLTLIQLVIFIAMKRSLTAFPVQVRLVYLLLLLVAFPEPLRLIYWLPAVGTWVLVLFAYCPMARTLSLMPWNRKEPFSLALLKRTVLKPPTTGSFLQTS